MHNPRLMAITGAVILLVVAALVLVIGKSVRKALSGGGSPGGSGRGSGKGRDWAVTPLPTGVARTLTERGLVNAEALANMSPAEREFFVATVAGKVGQGTKPRLHTPPAGSAAVQGTPGGSVPAPTAQAVAKTETHTYSSGINSSAPGAVTVTVTKTTTTIPQPVNTGALVSGPIHCPACRTPLGQRSETPLLMSRCPGCGRRVAVKAEGSKVTVTVEYGG